MARSTFGGTTDDSVEAIKTVAGQRVSSPQADISVTFWSAKTGGTQYTDLLDGNGNPATSISSDANGQLPEFQGPDGVFSMWADAGDGRVKINTNAGPSDAGVAGYLSDPGSASYAAAIGKLTPRLGIATTATSSGALAHDQHNPVDASGANRAMTLADAAGAGRFVIVEKTDSSTNTVTVTGNIRGAAGTTLTLYWQNESLMLVSKSDGSWWPVAGHKTKSSLDAFFAAKRTTVDLTYYVATWGNDANDGLSEGKPLKTLAAAAAKQPPVSQSFGTTTRSLRILVAPGDYHETSPIVFKKAANLEIIGTGGRGAAGIGAYGGTTIYTPIGQVGITIGFRDGADTTWTNAKGGCVLRNLQVRPETTDTGGSTGIKIIGMSNCSFHDVAVANYEGTGSIGWHMQSNSIANGGSGAATMYNSWYSCSASRCMTGFKSEGATLSLFGCLIDGNDDSVAAYLAGSTGVLLTGASSLHAHRLFIQGCETGIDDSQTHGSSTVYSLICHGLRMEACKTGVISNQLETLIKGGSFYSGSLTAGITGTVAFKMLAGAEFTIEDVSMATGVETQVSVDAGATGVRRDPHTGVTYWGSGLRGALEQYAGGTTPTGAVLAPAGTGATFNGFTTGSDDMHGEFTYTTGTTTSTGDIVRITFGTAFPSGKTPIVLVTRVGTGNLGAANTNLVDNTKFDIYFAVTPAQSTTYKIHYAVVGFVG